MTTSRPAYRRLSALLLLLALLPLAACDSGSDGPPEQDLLIRSGVSFQRLFSAPTAAEIDQVRQQWAQRDPAVQNASASAGVAVGGATVYVLSHTMSQGPGAPLVHHGLVRIPDGLGDDAPVLVVHHGGDSGVSLTTQGGFRTANASVEEMAEVFPALFSQTVQVIPSYRSEPLYTGGAGGLDPTYTSTGSPSPWDYDVDDAIALLSAALSLFGDETDAGRVAALGFSRGSNVALLHQIRDGRIDAVTEYYGPSDFYNASTEQLAVGLLLGLPGPLSLPGGEYLLNEVLRPLQGPGETYDADADYDAARLEVVRRSSSLFKSGLADLQIHHHTTDPVVPYAFSQAFDARAGSVSGDYAFNTYSNAIPAGASAHSPEGLPESQAATEGWLLQRLGLSSTRARAPLPASAH